MNIEKEWIKVWGEIEINRPASDSAVEIENPVYSKELGEFTQSPIDHRSTEHILDCYARAERDENYDYLHIEYGGGTGFTLRFARVIDPAELYFDVEGR